tara:strand:+ start:1228 stop:1893 length:666 start_codon:yes stop_codon:yes gene_type:complete
MKIISKNSGRVIQPLVNDEIRPEGGYYIPEVIRLTSERYGFTQIPTIDEARTGGAVFKDGRMIAGTSKFAIFEIAVFSDSIAVETANTETARLALDDILAWSADVLHFRQPKTIIPRVYDSAVVVEFEHSIDHIFGAVDQLCQLLQVGFRTTYESSGDVHIGSISVGCDPLESAPQLRRKWSIERRAGVKFDANRYFSFAPVDTDTHLKMLEKFEDIALQG